MRWNVWLRFFGRAGGHVPTVCFFAGTCLSSVGSFAFTHLRPALRKSFRAVDVAEARAYSAHFIRGHVLPAVRGLHVDALVFI